MTAKFSIRGVLARAALTLTSTALTLSVFECVLHFGDFLPSYRLELRNRGTPQSVRMIRLDPDVLYRIVPLPGGGNEINRDGYRDDEFTERSTAPHRVLVIGDSFVMGNNVPVEQTIPSVAEHACNGEIEFLNMGVAGYGPDQELVRYEQHRERFKADAVVLSVYAGNDFRDLVLNHLFVIGAEGALKRTSTNPVREAIPFFRTEMLIRVAFTGHYLPEATEHRLTDLLLFDKEEGLGSGTSQESSATVELMRAILNEFRRVVVTNGQKFFVMIVPGFLQMRSASLGGQDEKIFEAEKTLRRLCRDLSLACLDLTEQLLARGGVALYDPDDRHLNVQGTAVAGTALADLVRAEVIHARQ